jgi:hypothetical protein
MAHIELDVPDLNVNIESEINNTRVILRQPTTLVSQTSPYLNVAQSAITASYAVTSSYAIYALSLSGSIESASYSAFAASSSYALTASYVSGAASTWDTISNKPIGLVSSSTQISNYNIFVTTGSNQFNGNQYITGSLNVTQGITSSLFGTSSWANYATTASYVSGMSSDWDDITNKPSGLVSSSVQINTGSFSGSFTGQLIGTSSWANNSISSSYAETSSLTFKVSVYTGSATVGQASYTGSFTGSFNGTASFATTASYALNSSAITSSATAPAYPAQNELWYDNTTGKTYIYYVSASQGQWVLQSDPTYDVGAVVQAASSSITFTIPNFQPTTPLTGSIYFSGNWLYIYNGTKYVSASLN